MSAGRFAGVAVLTALSAGCGLIPERVPQDDPRVRPMFDAIARRTDRAALGFTEISRDAEVRAEFSPRANYDAMLHIGGKTGRTVAFRRTPSGYEWIHEQEIFAGPLTFDSPDGKFDESITITYETAPISGSPLNETSVSYLGERPELAFPRKLTVPVVKPWLKQWGY